MVCHARGNKQQAVGYYRKVISFARQNPKLDDARFEDYYWLLVASLDPTGSMGGARHAVPGNGRF
jgi:hypothetical protein